MLKIIHFRTRVQHGNKVRIKQIIFDFFFFFSRDKAATEVEECRKHLTENYSDGNVEYELVEVEGEGEVGVLVARYLEGQETEGNGADLIVCGSRNQGAIKRFVFGSVSDYLVHHVSIPVLVVKERKE